MKPSKKFNNRERKILWAWYVKNKKEVQTSFETFCDIVQQMPNFRLTLLFKRGLVKYS